MLGGVSIEETSTTTANNNPGTLNNGMYYSTDQQQSGKLDSNQQLFSVSNTVPLKQQQLCNTTLNQTNTSTTAPSSGMTGMSTIQLDQALDQVKFFIDCIVACSYLALCCSCSSTSGTTIWNAVISK